MYYNKAVVLGNFTRDPELKSLQSGSSVCSFSIATNRSYINKNKEKVQEVEYHNIVAYGKTAELIAQYMRKGSQILIEGRLHTRSWEKDGVKRYMTEIIVDQMQFGNKPRGSNESTQADVSQGAPQGEEEVNVDDIPF